MENTYINKSTEQKIAHFNSVMNHFEINSPQYETARKILGWLCSQQRKEEKLQALDTPPEPIQESHKNAWRFAREALPRNY